MALGGAIGFFGIVATILGRPEPILLFAAGALFGKGYGVWEERQ